MMYVQNNYLVLIFKVYVTIMRIKIIKCCMYIQNCKIMHIKIQFMSKNQIITHSSLT